LLPIKRIIFRLFSEERRHSTFEAFAVLVIRQLSCHRFAFHSDAVSAGMFKLLLSAAEFIIILHICPFSIQSVLFKAWPWHARLIFGMEALENARSVDSFEQGGKHACGRRTLGKSQMHSNKA
jgi:hypothetical protein